MPTAKISSSIHKIAGSTPLGVAGLEADGLGTAGLGVAELAYEIAELGVAEVGVAELGVAELGVAELGVDGLGVSEFVGVEVAVPTTWKLYHATPGTFLTTSDCPTSI